MSSIRVGEHCSTHTRLSGCLFLDVGRSCNIVVSSLGWRSFLQAEMLNDSCRSRSERATRVSSAPTSMRIHGERQAASTTPLGCAK